MLKRLIFCLWILLPFFLFAQNEEAYFTVHDSLTTGKHQGTFIKAMKKFLNFNDFDTTYISPNRYNYALMLDHFTNYEYYSVGTAVPEPQRLRFTPNPRMVCRYRWPPWKKKWEKQGNRIRPKSLQFEIWSGSFLSAYG